MSPKYSKHHQLFFIHFPKKGKNTHCENSKPKKKTGCDHGCPMEETLIF